MLYYISAVSLMVVMLGCFAGIFLSARYYNDNLLQRIGMSGLFVICLSRFEQLVELGEMTGRCVPISAQLCGHVGMALFTIGTAWKAFVDYNSTYANRTMQNAQFKTE